MLFVELVPVVVLAVLEDEATVEVLEAAELAGVLLDAAVVELVAAVVLEDEAAVVAVLEAVEELEAAELVVAGVLVGSLIVNVCPKTSVLPKVLAALSEATVTP